MLGILCGTSGSATLMPKGCHSARLANSRVCEWRRSLGAGRVYGDPYGRERNHTAVTLGDRLHFVTRPGASRSSRCHRVGCIQRGGGAGLRWCHRSECRLPCRRSRRRGRQKPERKGSRDKQRLLRHTDKTWHLCGVTFGTQDCVLSRLPLGLRDYNDSRFPERNRSIDEHE